MYICTHIYVYIYIYYIYIYLYMYTYIHITYNIYTRIHIQSDIVQKRSSNIYMYKYNTYHIQ